MRVSLLCLFVLVSYALGQTTEEVRHEGSWSGPTFDGGYLLDWETHMSGAYTLYEPDGTQLYSTSPLKLGFTNTSFIGLAADSDGTVAAIYYTHGPKPERAIVLIEPSGKRGLTIHAGAYVPTRICFADDHSIWTTGYEPPLKDDYFVFRRFSRDGKELEAFVPRSQVEPDENTFSFGELVGGGWTLRASKDRIGTYAYAGPWKQKWIEVSLSGNLIGQWEWDWDRSLSFDPSAFTVNNVLYARVFNYETPIGYAIFDRKTKTWKKVTGYPKGRLLGADGDDLVFSEEDGGWSILHRVPSGAVHILAGKKAQQFEPREH